GGRGWARSGAARRGGRDWVQEGRAAAGPPPRAFRTCLSIAAAVHPDRRKAFEAVRPQVAVGLVRPLGGLSDLAQQASERLRASYDYYQHMSAQTRYAELIPDAIVPEFALAGTPHECVQQLRDLLPLGFDDIPLSPYAVEGGTRADTIAALAREVIARL